MFKNNDVSAFTLENFSIGSIIRGCSHTEDYLVILDNPNTKSLRILNLQTFNVEEGEVKVNDPHFLTMEEAGELAYLTRLNYTRSDWDYVPRGLKSANK